jgi:hypothetical protein
MIDIQEEKMLKFMAFQAIIFPKFLKKFGKKITP